MKRMPAAFNKGEFGVVFVIAAALCYAVVNISIKLSTPYLTAWQMAMGRFILGAAIISILARPLRLDLLGAERWLLIILGMATAGAFLLLIQTFKMIPLSVGMVLFYLWPAFACLLSAWVADEPTTKGEWPFVLGALAGTVLILWPKEAGPGVNVGHLLAVGTSFLAGFAVILTRRLRRTNNPFTIYFYLCIVGGLVCLGPLLAQGYHILPTSWAGWLGLAAVAIFAMAGNVLMNQGMKHLNASKTGVLMMLEVLATVAFGIVCLDEVLSVRLLGGSALILGCGVALILLPMYYTSHVSKDNPI